MRPLPNAENLASKFLRTQPLVLASPLGDRTYTELPSNPVWPACRISRVGGSPDDYNLLHDHPLLQFDVWGGPKTQAHDIASLIRQRLTEGLPFWQDGYLKCVRRFGGFRYIPDTDYDPARPRYIFDVEFLVTR